MIVSIYLYSASFLSSEDWRKRLHKNGETSNYIIFIFLTGITQFLTYYKIMQSSENWYEYYMGISCVNSSSQLCWDNSFMANDYSKSITLL